MLAFVMVLLLSACSSKYDLGNTTLTNKEKERVLELLSKRNYINCMPGMLSDIDSSICSKHEELQNIGIKVVF